jgi:hypothetical protein
MTGGGPPEARPVFESPGAAGQIGEVYYVRWPDGSRLSSVRKVNDREARLLVEGGMCDEVRSPAGILRYLIMRRNAPVKRFASILAQGNFTTVTTGNLHEHTESKRRGL